MENLFCSKHIIGLIWTSILVVLLLIFSKRLSQKIGNDKLLKYGSLVLIALELIKYLYLGKNLTMNDFPLQFCSLMLYAYPIIAFGSEKVKRFVLPFAFSGGLLAALIALIMPTNILGDPTINWLDSANFQFTLSFVYHAYMVFYSLYLVTSNTYKPFFKDTIKASILILSFALLAIVANNIFDTDFMLLNKGNGNPFQFILKYNQYLYYLVHLIIFFILNTVLILIVRIFKGKSVVL